MEERVRSSKVVQIEAIFVVRGRPISFKRGGEGEVCVSRVVNDEEEAVETVLQRGWSVGWLAEDVEGVVGEVGRDYTVTLSR